MKTDRVSFLGVCIWGLALLFFFYEFFLRIFLGTIAADVISQLRLSAGQFSAIAAGYYIAYGLIQVPVGLIAERVGARLTLSAACLICAFGVFLLSLARGFTLAFVSRLFIGFGSGFAFVSLLLLILQWFPKRHFSVMTGLSIFLGAIGPLLAGAPLAYFYKAMNGNWRGILFWLGLFGCALTAVLFIFIVNRPKEAEQRIIFLSPTREKAYDLIKTLLQNRQSWFVLAYTATTYVVLPLFAAYWGTLFLQARGIELTLSALIISMIWIGYAIGSPLIGKLSDLTKRRKPYLYFPALLGAIASFLILYLPLKSEAYLILLFILVGAGVAGQSLSFSVILEHVPRKLHSTALGVNNAVSMLSAAVIPILVGVIVQIANDQSAKTSYISEHALRQGLLVVPLLFLIAFFVSLFCISETYCRQQNEVHTLHRYSDIIG